MAVKYPAIIDFTMVWALRILIRKMGGRPRGGTLGGTGPVTLPKVSSDRRGRSHLGPVSSHQTKTGLAQHRHARVSNLDLFE